MNKKLTNIIAAAIIALSSTQVGAASVVTGSIQLTRDASRNINGAFIVTEKRDSAGKAIALALVMDENGKAIAQQYENKTVKIEGSLQGRNLTADTWKEVKDNSYSSSSSSSYSDDSSSYEEEPSEDSEEEYSDDEERKNKNKKKKTSKKKKASEDENSDEEVEEASEEETEEAHENESESEEEHSEEEEEHNEEESEQEYDSNEASDEEGGEE